MLKGTLDDFTLPDMFRLMSFAKKTGRLDVERRAGHGSVFFREGEVYYAESSLTKIPLGQKLLRAGVITESQLNKALDANAESGERVGEILMQTGVVDGEQLETTLRAQIEDAVFDLLRWDLGEFSWEPNAAVDPEVGIMVSVENLTRFPPPSTMLRSDASTSIGSTWRSPSPPRILRPPWEACARFDAPGQT